MAHQSLYPLDWHEATIRPAPFMELLLAPRFGLAHSELRFFAAPERAMRFIAVEDLRTSCRACVRGAGSDIHACVTILAGVARTTPQRERWGIQQ